jgi:glycosyl transferase family 25
MSDQMLELAQSMVAMGDAQGALARCSEILAAQPEHKGAQALAALIQCRSGQIAAYRINLDKRPDRLSECRANEGQFLYPEEFIVRLPAVADEFGAVGCGKSHVVALADAFARQSAPYCMVLEDDFNFLRPASDLFSALGRMRASGLQWDVLLLSATEVKPIDQPPEAPFLLRVFEGQTTSGYIVNRPYLPKLISCFSETVAQLERFRDVDARAYIVSRFAIDIAWKQLQRRDRWFIANPSFGHQRAGYSDIEGKVEDYQKTTFYRWP